MYFEIVTCPCYGDLVKERQNCSNIYDFRCSCHRIHEIYISKCSANLLVCNFNTKKRCFCHECTQYEVCAVCIEKRYNLNWTVPKVCLRYLPEYVQKDEIKLEHFLDQKMQSEPLFILKTV